MPAGLAAYSPPKGLSSLLSGRLWVDCRRMDQGGLLLADPSPRRSPRIRPAPLPAGGPATSRRKRELCSLPSTQHRHAVRRAHALSLGQHEDGIYLGFERRAARCSWTISGDCGSAVEDSRARDVVAGTNTSGDRAIKRPVPDAILRGRTNILMVTRRHSAGRDAPPDRSR